MICIERAIEGKQFLHCYKGVLEKYMLYGSRSSKKVDYFHYFIKCKLESVLTKNNGYEIKLEQYVDSLNSKKKKKCDIVVFKNNIPYIVFPVKLTMTNYKQNKNNVWENLTGEIMHLKWRNHDNLHIIPINIYMNYIPYLDKAKTIKKFENIKYDDIKQYEILNEKNLTYDMINYIIDVKYDENECKIGSTYSKIPDILYFNKNTPYRSFNDILEKLL